MTKHVVFELLIPVKSILKCINGSIEQLYMQF